MKLNEFDAYASIIIIQCSKDAMLLIFFCDIQTHTDRIRIYQKKKRDRKNFDDKQYIICTNVSKSDNPCNTHLSKMCVQSNNHIRTLNARTYDI